MTGKIYAAILASALMAGTPVFASEGGEGNNHECNGQGNPNSPCEGGGHGGGHARIHNWNKNNNKNYNTNVNVNENTAVSISDASARAKQSQQQDQGQGQIQGNSNSIEGDNVRVYAPAPSAFAPALTSAPETCFGSTSAGASGGNGIFGFGVSFGSTWKSDDCELRMFARSLQALGETKAALALLAQNEKVAAALKEARESK